MTQDERVEVVARACFEIGNERLKAERDWEKLAPTYRAEAQSILTALDAYDRERGEERRDAIQRALRSLESVGTWRPSERKDLEDARAALAAALKYEPPEKLDSLAHARFLVDQQAEDAGLWFQAQTASEAHLQQQLRRLHAVIEVEPPAPEQFREEWREGLERYAADLTVEECEELRKALDELEGRPPALREEWRACGEGPHSGGKSRATASRAEAEERVARMLGYAEETGFERAWLEHRLVSEWERVES